MFAKWGSVLVAAVIAAAIVLGGSFLATTFIPNQDAQRRNEDIAVLALACDDFLLAFKADGPWTKDLLSAGTAVSVLGSSGPISQAEAKRVMAVTDAHFRAKAIKDMRSACGVDLLKIRIK